MRISNAFKSIKSITAEHKQGLFIGIGIGGIVITAVLAAKGGYKASHRISDIHLNPNADIDTFPMSTSDKVKETWRYYVPAALTGIASISCIIAGVKIGDKKTAIAAGLYSVAEGTLREYRDEVISALGLDQEKELYDRVVQAHMDRNPIVENEIILCESDDDVQCFDTMSGRCFVSSRIKIDSIVNELNKELLHDDHLYLNDFYYEVGLQNTDSGALLGWTTDRSLIKVEYSACLGKNSKPCLGITLNCSVLS